MDKRSALVIQVFEKLGTPLMAAVNDVASSNPAAADDRNDAGKVAELLGKTVQLSIALTNVMDIKDTGTTADNVRLALAGLVSPLIANHYRQTQKVPNDGDIKRMVTALESILTFSDNFAPLAETIKRMAHIDPDLTAIADENQATIQYISTMAPVIHEVGRFSFGQPEQKLIQDVSDKLMKRAQEIVARMSGIGNDPASLKQAEVQCLKALAGMYTACHKAETDKMMNMSEEARAQNPDAGGAAALEKVWANFDKKAGMVEVLSQSAAPAAGAVASTSSTTPATETTAVPPAAPVASPPVAEQPPAPAPEVQPAPAAAPQAPEQPAAPVAPPPPPATPPAQEAPVEAAADGGAYNPMGFFKPGGASEETSSESPPAAAPVETPLAPPLAEQPPAPAPEVQPAPAAAPQTPEQPAAPVAPPPPPATPPAQEAPAEAAADEGSYNPMGFFKPGAKTEADAGSDDGGAQNV